MKKIKKLLLANRGEIAIRVFRTCREMGISTVALYTPPDERALHARMADEAVRISSYLSIDDIVGAAKRVGADAIHPGYGFLSENGDFAEACEKTGLVFIGPTSKSIRMMGDKIRAKKLMREAGVPVVPEDGYPLLVKASAGGGGRGMRVVRDEKELAAAKESAKREAERAFGNGELLLERYLEPARHIEVQVFGDTHGNVIHLFERECSLQRRHQKILEESPSPTLAQPIKEKLWEAAVRAAKAVDYVNAGTVEFVVGPNDEFYFLEMNTRLQVEHPVTELVCGRDLVRLQIAVAEGAELPRENQSNGHAVEVRLYAEDPAKRFLPVAGRMVRWEAPEGVRVDTGVHSGSEVSVHYDPMLAKVIAWGENRADALRKLSAALDLLVVHGLRTNRDFLRALVKHPDVVSGKLSTGLVESKLSELMASVAVSDEDRKLGDEVASAYLRAREGRRERLPGVPLGFRNNPFPPRAVEAVKIVELGEGWCVAEKEECRRRYTVTEQGELVHLQWRQSPVVTVPRPNRFPTVGSNQRDPGVHAPMTGKVMKVHAVKGQQLRGGEPLVVLEAMKMEQTIASNVSGVVDRVLVGEGDLVQAGAKLVDVVPE